jgi:hypothetical protein
LAPVSDSVEELVSFVSAPAPEMPPESVCAALLEYSNVDATVLIPIGWL